MPDGLAGNTWTSSKFLMVGLFHAVFYEDFGCFWLYDFAFAFDIYNFMEHGIRSECGFFGMNVVEKTVTQHVVEI